MRRKAFMEINKNRILTQGSLAIRQDDRNTDTAPGARDGIIAGKILGKIMGFPCPAKSPWEIVAIARHQNRPVLQDYISLICTGFIELHGDRSFGDDRALIGGFATLDGIRVMLIGHNKGKNIEESIERNFGMARPEGYRKALRLMKLAEMYALPVVTLVDTPGAYPGIDAEERGQAEAIARNLVEMSRLGTPIVTVITGEGGSGGALGIAVADRILMLENSVYSVISPEGCAAILWRDSNFAPQAAEALKLTAADLLELGIIDEIVREPHGGAHTDHSEAADTLQKSVTGNIKKLLAVPKEDLIEERFKKLSSMGRFAR
jgi:acetyl-CoA carboxylase carboxyl transferase subunit alpha